ncbi:MAG: citrate synthase/methylcitrate synthase [Minwuiales bacterium]|nr:citrate synthase/methylcitrate synthase [Minwuiales bacterium]
MSDGLDGVVAAETVLSHVDGAGGRLILRGSDLEAVAGRQSLEATAAMLWRGLTDSLPDEAGMRAALGAARVDAFRAMPALLPLTRDLTLLEGLRLGLAGLSDRATQPHHLLVTAAIPVFVAALCRAAEGAAPVAPDPTLGHAADFLRMIRGAKATPAETHALETYLVTVSDHGLNASTFTARVIASTQAGMISAVLGALCALKGPLHGGAPGPVLDMLDAIGSVANARPWLEAALGRGERLMGFGHRVYRVRDPRADVLKSAVADLRGGANRIAFAEQVERAALEILHERYPGRRLDTNVEFYTALLLEALHLPRDAFTAVFAAGRVIGWAAHILEQEANGRLIRPQSKYVGPVPHAA